jgi:hypothetical protein
VLVCLPPCSVFLPPPPPPTTLVEALDPKVMVPLTGNDALSSIADDAGQRLAAALNALTHAPATT